MRARGRWAQAAGSRRRPFLVGGEAFGAELLHDLLEDGVLLGADDGVLVVEDEGGDAGDTDRARPVDAVVDLLDVGAALERFAEGGLVEADLAAEADEGVEVAEVLEGGEVSLEEQLVELVLLLASAVLAGELGGLEREVGVGGEGAAAAELDAERLASEFEVGLGSVRGGARRAFTALGRDRGVEEKGRPFDVDVPFLLELLDLDETDVAPGSDEVADDGDGGSLVLVRLNHKSLRQMRRFTA
jgi:hypothetical protein